jgi:hypothetical protein
MNFAIETLKAELDRVEYQLEDLASDSPKILFLLGLKDALSMEERRERIFVLETKRDQFISAIKNLEDAR